MRQGNNKNFALQLYSIGSNTCNGMCTLDLFVITKTKDGKQNTFESRRQVDNRYNPEIDRSEAAFKVAQLAY